MISADKQGWYDIIFTRADWRMAICRNAATPGYFEWVQQMKKSLASLQTPALSSSSWRTADGQWLITLIGAEHRKNSFVYKLHTTG